MKHLQAAGKILDLYLNPDETATALIKEQLQKLERVASDLIEPVNQEKSPEYLKQHFFFDRKATFSFDDITFSFLHILEKFCQKLEDPSQWLGNDSNMAAAKLNKLLISAVILAAQIEYDNGISRQGYLKHPYLQQLILFSHNVLETPNYTDSLVTYFEDKIAKHPALEKLLEMSLNFIDDKLVEKGQPLMQQPWVTANEYANQRPKLFSTLIEKANGVRELMTNETNLWELPGYSANSKERAATVFATLKKWDLDLLLATDFEVTPSKLRIHQIANSYGDKETILTEVKEEQECINAKNFNKATFMLHLKAWHLDDLESITLTTKENIANYWNESKSRDSNLSLRAIDWLSIRPTEVDEFQKNIEKSSYEQLSYLQFLRQESLTLLSDSDNEELRAQVEKHFSNITKHLYQEVSNESVNNIRDELDPIYNLINELELPIDDLAEEQARLLASKRERILTFIDSNNTIKILVEENIKTLEQQMVKFEKEINSLNETEKLLKNDKNAASSQSTSSNIFSTKKISLVFSPTNNSVDDKNCQQKIFDTKKQILTTKLNINQRERIVLGIKTDLAELTLEPDDVLDKLDEDYDNNLEQKQLLKDMIKNLQAKQNNAQAPYKDATLPINSNQMPTTPRMM